MTSDTFFALLIWWSLGFAGALLARYAFLAERHKPGPPLTWGGLIGAAIAAWLCPLVWLAAAIWWFCWFLDNRYARTWLSKPVFKGRHESMRYGVLRSAGGSRPEGP